MPASARGEFGALLEELRRMFPAPDRYDGVDEDAAAATAGGVVLAYDRFIHTGKSP